MFLFSEKNNLLKPLQVEEGIAEHCALQKVRNLSPLCIMWKVIIQTIHCNWLLVVLCYLNICDYRSLGLDVRVVCFFDIPGEPPSYRPLRPRSTSEAISALSRDDLCNISSNDHSQIHPPSGRRNSADRARTASCISPPHQEDDLDLCPPAAGMSTLDFDPMSFQCSPLSATPGPQRNRDGSKWRKGAGCSSESEPISSPQNNISCSQSPDISPVPGKGWEKVTSEPLSPKLGKKSFKTRADVQAAFTSLPPFPSSSPPVEKPEAPVGDGREPRVSYQHCSPLSSASQASALTDLSQSAQNLPDPGQCHSRLTSHITYAVYS